MSSIQPRITQNGSRNICLLGRSVLLLAVGVGLLLWPVNSSGAGLAAGENFAKDWKPMAEHGTWEVVSDNEVKQTLDDPKGQHVGNTGFTRLIEQSGTMEYEWSLNMADLSKGCGLYLFASDPDKNERGNAYLIWLSSGKGSAPGKMAVAKIINDKFPKDLMKLPVKVESGKWNTLRVRYDSDAGLFALWLNGQQVGTCTDRAPYKKGSCVSLTTCVTQGSYKNMTIKKLK